jgi:DNA-binding FadR family transcriptional regulator
LFYVWHGICGDGANYQNFADIYRKRKKSMRRVRLTEGQLHNVIRESVNNILNEGFMDKMKGAYQGFRQGQDQMDNNQQNQNQKQQLIDSIQQYAQFGVQSCEALMEEKDEQYSEYIKNYIWAYLKNISSEIQELQKMQ